MLHHVIDWRRALAEIYRVLRPGGLFFFEEVPGSSLSSWPARVLLDHPKENRFEADEFAAEVRGQGFVVGDIERRARGHVFFGVCRRSELPDSNKATDEAARERPRVS
jgi:SAM-dependent methyltransferase